MNKYFFYYYLPGTQILLPNYNQQLLLCVNEIIILVLLSQDVFP